jgi:putative membrane protein
LWRQFPPALFGKLNPQKEQAAFSWHPVYSLLALTGRANTATAYLLNSSNKIDNLKTQTMKKTTFTILFFSSLVIAVSCNNDKNTDSKEMAKEMNDEKFDDTTIEDDTKFAVKAADAGMMEVQISQLAQSKSTSPTVKELAQMMIDDHSKANEELKTAAAQKNITLPLSLGDKNQEKYNDLANKSGVDFDEAYIDCLRKDHKEAIDAFEKEADKGNDPDLKAWAAAKLPTLQHHLQMVETADETLKNNKSARR